MDLIIYYNYYCFFQILPLQTEIRVAYKNGLEDEQCFIQNLALFICTFLKEHGRQIEEKVTWENTRI